MSSHLTLRRIATMAMFLMMVIGQRSLVWGQTEMASSDHSLSINATFSPIPLTDALNQLKAHFGVSFFYNPDDVARHKVRFKITNGDVERHLETLLTPLGFDYEAVSNKVYVILKAEQQQSTGSLAPVNSTSVAWAGNVPTTAMLPATSSSVASNSIATMTVMPKPVATVVADRLISGTVYEAETGDPMPGVSVVIKGTSMGTTTDVAGKYKLSVPEDAKTLVFTMVGLTRQEVAIGRRNTINVSMIADQKLLNEVVVVGYGEQQRKDLTGSISSIKADDLKTVPQAGIDQMMQGRASGVVVQQNTGQPGGGVSVRIRGITSLTGSNEPLYVIDGVPFQGDGQQSQAFYVFGGGGGQTSQSILASINPSDIVSIDILKDASATAIYGARASNGVVIITTKRGKAQDSRVSYETYVGLQQVQRYVPVMNLRDYARYSVSVDSIYSRTSPEEYRRPELLGEGTNWQKEIFQNARVQNHQVSLSGGKDRTTFYISANYFAQDGIVVGSNFDRMSVRLNLDNQAKSWLKVGTSFNLSRTNQRVTLNDDDQGVVSAALLQSPETPVKYTDGSWGGPLEGTFGYQVNPVALALLREANRQQTRAIGNMYADVTLLRGLTFRSEIASDFNIGDNSAFNPTYRWGATVNEQNKYVRSVNNSLFWAWKNYLTYNRDFGKNGVHHLNIVGGHEANKSTYEWLNGTRTGFLTNDIQALNAGNAVTATNENGKGVWALESYFGRMNYNFKDRYSVTFTGRWDGSINFGPESRWGFFPAAAAAWTISNEKFLSNSKAISNLKLRIGYGEVGNQNLPPYTYLPALRSYLTAYGTGFAVNRIPNSKIRWESATQANLGLDLGLWSNRVALSVDIYDKISRDFIYQLPAPAYTGAGSNWTDIQSPFLNLGRMENRGIDLTLNTQNVNSSKFTWNSTFIFSHYRNKLLELADEGAAIYRNVQWFNTVTKSEVGQPVGQFYGYQVNGIFQTPEQLASSPFQSNETNVGDLIYANTDNTSVDANGRQIVDGKDRVFIGSPHPDFTYGVTNSFGFGPVSLSVFVQGSQGAEIFNFTRRYTEGMQGIGFNQAASVANHWTPSNTNTDIPRPTTTQQNVAISDRFVEDGSYLRIQTVSLGYTLPAGTLSRAKITQARVFANVQNAWTFTKYKGFDPELGSFNQDALLTNVDNGHYPNPRAYTIGLSVEF
jgi:TonB-dependent starch-binding outer membrane protein SusC